MERRRWEMVSALNFSARIGSLSVSWRTGSQSVVAIFSVAKERIVVAAMSWTARQQQICMILETSL